MIELSKLEEYSSLAFDKEMSRYFIKLLKKHLVNDMLQFYEKLTNNPKDIWQDIEVKYTDDDYKFIDTFADQDAPKFKNYDKLKSLMVKPELKDSRGNDIPEPPLKMDFALNNHFPIDVRHLAHVLSSSRFRTDLMNLPNNP